MLDERTLSGMNQNQLLRYVSTLHQAIEHILGAAGEAQQFVERNGADAQRSAQRNPMEQLAAALAGNGR